MKKGIRYYIFDFLVIVAGITVSLYAGSRLELHNQRQEEVRILENLRDNLTADTQSIGQEIAVLTDCQRRYGYLLEDSIPFKTDSVAILFSSLLVYTTNEIRESAYEEMKHSGKMGIIENKELLNNIIRHYEEEQALLVDEYNSIDKHFILNRMITYIENDFKWYSSKTFFDPNELPEMLAFFQQTAMRNLVQSNLIFKTNTIVTYRQYLASALELITMIDSELERLGA